MRTDTLINVVTGNVGEKATVTQIYAPGQPGFEAEVLSNAPDLPVFSPEWLQFFQESVPVIGRKAQISALDAFMQADLPFLWWGVYGPAGIGKSRLAHELLRLHPTWEGGFLAADRSNVGAASVWQPTGNALWIVDYAASRGEAVSKMLCILARRFAQSQTKVRVLLLERSAGEQAGWWRSLIQEAGHQSMLLQKSLYDNPLELPPLGDNAPSVLVAWLTAGGIAAGEAHRLAAGFTPEALALATADGRPLLLGLVAAGLHRGTFNPSRRAMPDDCLDDYLSRELRYMAEQNTSRDFGQACLTLFSATLEGGKPALSALRGQTPEPPGAEQLMALQSGLNVLASRGISERSDWALRPDALGERFIEVMAIRAPSVVARYGVLPKYDAVQYGRLIYLAAQASGQVFTTLARMPDASVRALLALLLQHGTMRALLIALKSLALVRGAPLSPDYASLLSVKYFGARHIPKVEAFVQAGFAYADNAPLEDLKACLDPKRDADLAVWLVPFVASITALDGLRLHRLCIWYAELYPDANIQRARELVLALKLLVQLAWGLIVNFQDDKSALALMGRWKVEGDSFGDKFCQAVVGLCESIEKDVTKVFPDTKKVDADELAKTMSLASVQLSFVLLAGGSLLSEQLEGKLWLSAAAEIAQRGLRWADFTQNAREYALCQRNLMAANSAQNPMDKEPWETRFALMRQCAQLGNRQDWKELAVDGLRIAARAGQAAPACRVAAEALACTDWLEEAVIPLLAEGERFVALIGRRLQARDWGGAMQCFRAYTNLLHPLTTDSRVMPMEILNMADMLAHYGAACGCEAQAELHQLLESLFDSTLPDQPRSLLAVTTMANIAVAHLLEGAPNPFQRLAFELVLPAPVPSDPQLLALGCAPEDLQTMTVNVVRVTSREIASYEQNLFVLTHNDQPLDVEGTVPLGGGTVPT